MNLKKALIVIVLLLALLSQLLLTQASFYMAYIGGDVDEVNNTVICYLRYVPENNDPEIKEIKSIELYDTINYYTDERETFNITDQLEYTVLIDSVYFARITYEWIDAYAWHEIEMKIYYEDTEGIVRLIRFFNVFFDDYYEEPVDDNGQHGNNGTNGNHYGNNGTHGNNRRGNRRGHGHAYGWRTRRIV